MRNWKQFMSGALLLTTMAFAQQEPKPDQKQNPSDVQVEPGPESASEPRSIFGESMASRFTIVTAASAQGEYDDNIFSSGSLRMSDWVTRLSGRITATLQRKHSLFELHYLPGYTLYSEFSDRNSYNQQGILMWDQQFTAATGMRLNGDVSDYSNASLPQYTLVPQGRTFVPVFAPGGLQTNTRVLASTTNWTLNHKFSGTSAMWVGINGETTSFRNEFGLNGVSPLLASDTYAVGGTLGWNREVTPGRTIGVEVGHRYFGFQTPASHNNYSYAKLRFEQKFHQQYTFSVGAGPAVSRILGQDWHPDYAIDAGLTRQTKGTTIGVNFSHETRLSNFQGALGATTATASIGLRGLRHWTTTSTFGFSRNAIIGNLGDLDTYSGSQRIGYAFSPSWEVFTSYSHVSQMGSSIVPNQKYHRNLFSFGISYTLSPAVRY